MRGNIREQITKWLSENSETDGIEVFENYDGLIGRVRSSPPDFCFIRLGRNGIPGLKAAEEVQRISRDIRVVFVSESGNHAIDAYEVGAYGYLIPPITKAKLDKCLINNG
jgi:DNA-binding NarL/FixJ family response regulator